MSTIENLGYVLIAAIPLLIFVDCFLAAYKTRRSQKSQGYTGKDRRSKDRRMKEDSQRVSRPE
jgi:hypothetical protein